jgi:small-conductance mechanosensitive channel
MLSEPFSSLAILALVATMALVFVYLAFDLQRAFRSADARNHEAAAATIGQLLTTGLVLSALVTALAVWRGLVVVAVVAATSFWLLAAASARFSRTCRARDAAVYKIPPSHIRR